MQTLTKPADSPARLLDVQAVAELLDCSTRTVYRLSDRGAMPAPYKLGNLCRWSQSSIESWIDNGCKPIRPATGGLADDCTD